MRYLLKISYRDSTTHIALEPQDLMARPAAVMTRAQRLLRAFGIEIDRCARCQEKLRVLASIEDRRSSPGY